MDLINNDRLDALLEASPAPRVTKEGIKARIEEAFFTKIGLTLTHCRIVLDNGFSVSGESACVNAANYNEEIGNKIAYDNAFAKLWQLYGFLLAENNLRARTLEDSEKVAVG